MENRKRLTKAVMSAAWLGLWANVLLACVKLAAGEICSSSALVTDGVHSVSDACASVVTLTGLYLSRRERDESHQYGHGRFECIAAMILSFVLLAAGCAMAMELVGQVIAGDIGGENTPGALAAGVSAMSIVVKLWLCSFMRKMARSSGSTALEAEALHNRSDALSSVSSLVGVIGAEMGVPLVDPIAGAVIAGFIIFSAVEVFRQAVCGLVDKACDRKTSDRMFKIAERCTGSDVKSIRTRRSGSGFFAELEIVFPSELDISSGCMRAEKLRRELFRELPSLEDCTVTFSCENHQ